MRPPLPLWPLLTLVLGGCGTFADPTEWFGEDSGPTHADLVEFEPRIALRTLWRDDIGSGAAGRLVGLQPRLAGERLYVAEYNGGVEARDAASGERHWAQSLDLPLTGGPGVGEGLVLVGTQDGQVVALDAETGAQKWLSKVSSEVLSAPAAALGIVVVHSIDGNITGLDAATGAERWRYGHKAPTLTLRGSSTPVVSGATVISGQAGGRLVALAIGSGTPVWDIQVTVPSGRSELERLADIDGDPLVVNGAIFVTTYQGDVAAVGEASGRVLWRRPLSAYTGVANDWLQIYLADAEGHVWALDPDTGAARWRQEQLQGRRLSAPAVIGQYVVVGDFEGYLHWLAQEDGSLAGRIRVGRDPVRLVADASNRVLYVYSSDGDLRAVTLPEE